MKIKEYLIELARYADVLMNPSLEEIDDYFDEPKNINFIAYNGKLFISTYSLKKMKIYIESQKSSNFIEGKAKRVGKRWIGEVANKSGNKNWSWVNKFIKL